MTLLWLLLLLHAASARNITEQENAALKEKCKLVESPGSEEDSSSTLVRIRGTVEVSEYSFAVALSRINRVPDLSTGETRETHSRPFCSGVLISPRHILTAAHCLVYNVKAYCNKGLPPKRYPAERIGVFLKKDCDNVRCWEANEPLKISSVLVHPSYKPVAYRRYMAAIQRSKAAVNCPVGYDIALMELNQDVYDNPVCMPKAGTVILRPENIESIGYGDVDGSRIQSVKYDVVEQYNNDKLIFAYNMTSNVTPDTVEGDSGGPLIQNLEGKRCLLGITSCKANKTKDGIRVGAGAAFCDVRKHLEWICRETGVCPLSGITTQQWKPAPSPPQSDSPNEFTSE